MSLNGRIGRAALGAAVALVAAGAGAMAPAAPERDRAVPSRAPLAAVAGPGTSMVITHLDPLTLRREGPTDTLGEWHDGYSFSPDREAIAFGISAPGTGGRVGIRVVDTDDLNPTANIETGVFADALAWLEPRRLVAMLGGACTNTCAALTGRPRSFQAVVVDPVTGEELQRHLLPAGDAGRRCGVVEARGEALLALVGRIVFVIRAEGDYETVPLPQPFPKCGNLVAVPGGETAFALSVRGEVVAELDLASSQLEVHRVADPAPGKVRAIALDDRRLVMVRSRPNGQPDGVELLDLDRERRRTLDPRADDAVLVDGTILTSGGHGVRGYDRNGRREFALLDQERIVTVEPFGRFAYAVNRKGFAIIDVRAGSVVHRFSVRPPQRPGFLLRPEGP